jgi:hypothetical protein
MSNRSSNENNKAGPTCRLLRSLSAMLRPLLLLALLAPAVADSLQQLSACLASATCSASSYESFDDSLLVRAATGASADAPAVAHFLVGVVSGWDLSKVYQSYHENVIAALPAATHDVFFAFSRRGGSAPRDTEQLFADFNVVSASLGDAPRERLLDFCLRSAMNTEQRRRVQAAVQHAPQRLSDC